MRINILIILTDFQPMFSGGIEVEHGWKWVKLHQNADMPTLPIPEGDSHFRSFNLFSALFLNFQNDT